MIRARASPILLSLASRVAATSLRVQHRRVLSVDANAGAVPVGLSSLVGRATAAGWDYRRLYVVLLGHRFLPSCRTILPPTRGAWAPPSAAAPSPSSSRSATNGLQGRIRPSSGSPPSHAAPDRRSRPSGARAVEHASSICGAPFLPPTPILADGASPWTPRPPSTRPSWPPRRRASSKGPTRAAAAAAAGAGRLRCRFFADWRSRAATTPRRAADSASAQIAARPHGRRGRPRRGPRGREAAGRAAAAAAAAGRVVQRRRPQPRRVPRGAGDRRATAARTASTTTAGATDARTAITTTAGATDATTVGATAATTGGTTAATTGGATTGGTARCRRRPTRWSASARRRSATT